MDVITFNQKKDISNITSNQDKMVFILDEVLIPSLLQGVKEKYTTFIEILKTAEDPAFTSMAEKIGMRW